MSHPDPRPVTVRTVADHPMISDGGPGDFALVHERGVHGFRNDGDDPVSFLILFRPRPLSPPASFTPGIACEQFFAEPAELRRSGRTLAPEEMTAFYARHDQVMVEV